jgi:tRNA pseudouridine55 synthase
MEVIQKRIGETPLQALERYRREQKIGADVPMTYAGRLDPMAEGALLILVGDECKNKEKYLGLDKEYEVEIVFGISTDTYDALGLAWAGVLPNSLCKNDTLPDTFAAQQSQSKISHESGTKSVIFSKWLEPDRYPCTFKQKYPAYSSKTVDGRQLHELVRSNELPEEMPTRNVTIYSLEVLERTKISATELQERIIRNIDLVTGDFRQANVKQQWTELLSGSSQNFDLVKIRVRCSSGTYMRSLASKVGEEAGMGAFALSIKRTQIFDI